MLQQTQVATVLPYFARWMEALPDFGALAAADEATVLKLWEGLGYYRRARLLHRLARELAARPAPPRTAAAWRELPGVGPYTAAAIASLAFDDPAAVVDGNVVRILARLKGETSAFANGAAAVKHFTQLAGQLLDPRHPGRHNEAMMELGATVCTRAKPKCDLCPVRQWCAAAEAGRAGELPRIRRPVTEDREVDRVWIVRDGALLLHRIPAHARRMNGLHELPTAAQAGVPAAKLRDVNLLATHRRGITRFRITERIHRAVPTARTRDLDRNAAEGATDAETGLLWVPVARLDAIALSGPHRRWIRELLASARSSSQPAAPRASK